MAKEIGKGNKMLWIVPYLVPTTIALASVFGSSWTMLQRMEQKFVDYQASQKEAWIAYQEKDELKLKALEIANILLKKEGSDLSRRNTVAIVEIKGDIKSINSNLAEQRTMNKDQMAVMQEILKEVRRQ